MKKESKLLKINFNNNDQSKNQSVEKDFSGSNNFNDDDEATFRQLSTKQRLIGKTLNQKPKNLTPSECKSVIQSLQKQKKIRSNINVGTWSSNENIPEMNTKKGLIIGKEKFRKVRKRKAQKIRHLKHLHKISKTIFRSRMDMLNTHDVYIPYTWMDNDCKSKSVEKFTVDFQNNDEIKSLIGESIQYFSTFSQSNDGLESFEVISRKESENDSLERQTLDSIQEEFDQIFVNDIFDGRKIFNDN